MIASTARIGRCAWARMVLSIAMAAAGCAHGRAEPGDIEVTLAMCALLSMEGVDSSDDEVRYWYQVERAKASRRMWHRGGMRALQSRIASTPAGRDRLCLERALREAHARTVEHF